MGDAGLGVRLIGRGLRMWSRSPALMGWGLIPGVLAGALLTAAWLTVALQAPSWSASLVGLVTDADAWWVRLMEFAAAVGMVVGASLLAVYLFTTLTLALGGPFFDRLSQRAAAMVGLALEDPAESPWRSLTRSLGESAVRLALTAVTAVFALLIGLVPVVGSVSAFILTSTVGGFFLAMELTATPAGGRGYVTRASRSRLLRHRRALTQGFGTGVYVLFLIPGVAVLMMPAVVVGATLLVNELLTGQSPSLGAPEEGSSHPSVQ